MTTDQRSGAYAEILSPFAIGGMSLRNRLVFQPHFTALGTAPITRNAPAAAWR
jgi:2,4-dienoyl-CoA reductase-like NADH-dependent reductase (Old Yellow Enzyme family)